MKDQGDTMNTTQTVQWRHSLEDAQAESRQSGKPLLIELFSPRCGGCMTMERETFEDPETIRWIEEHFVPVHFDVLADEEPMTRFNSGWTPTALGQGAGGDEVRRWPGRPGPAAALPECAPITRFSSGWTPALLVQGAAGDEFRRSQGYLDRARFKA